MVTQLEIPAEELQQFQPFVRIFNKGKVIVKEGQTSDQRIFLLRQGSVEVYRQAGTESQLLGKIDSVNFFGEMAIVSQRPRTATIIAISEPTVVYAFDNPNLASILANPTWGTMLVRRLADNLEERHQSYEAARIQTERLRSAIGDMVGAMVNLFAVAGNDVESKEMFLEALPKLISAHINGMDIKLRIPEQDRLKQYWRLGIIPEKLYRQAIITRTKLKE